MKYARGPLSAALCAASILAACAPAWAADAFPRVQLPTHETSPHRAAYIALAGGVTLIASSFLLERQADRAYDSYLSATTPNEISSLFDRTGRYDRLSSAALISGNVLVATGLALRFLHRPGPAHLQLAFDSRRCGVRYSF